MLIKIPKSNKEIDRAANVSINPDSIQEQLSHIGSVTQNMSPSNSFLVTFNPI